MNYFTSPQLFISITAKKIAIELIKELSIQKTAKLTLFLDVNPCYDGHQAVFIWVEHYLQKHVDSDFNHIRHAFINCFPTD